MADYLNLPLGDEAPEIVTAVVEIPQGSVNKYEYDKKLHVFRLDRNLFSPVHYPGDYGFVPRTLAEDGDPLDILILGDSPTFPGCVYDARPIGLFEMLDPVVTSVVVSQNSSPRALPVDDLAAVAVDVLGDSRVEVAPRLDDAIEVAVTTAEEDLVGGSGVLVTGSIVTVGEARTLLTPERQP